MAEQQIPILKVAGSIPVVLIFEAYLFFTQEKSFNIL